MSDLPIETLPVGAPVTIDAVVCEPGARNAVKYCVTSASTSGFRTNNISFELKTVAPVVIDSAIRREIEDAYLARCAKHGTQPYASSHEMLGVLVEELHEVIEAIRANDRAAIDREVMDLMLPCLHWLSAKRGEAE